MSHAGYYDRYIAEDADDTHVTISVTHVDAYEIATEDDEPDEFMPEHWVLSDDGGDWDDATIEHEPHVDPDVAKRVEHYKAAGLTVSVLRDGTAQEDR